MMSDYAMAVAPLGNHRAEAVIAQRRHDSDKIVQHMEQTMEVEAVIPPRFHCKRGAGLQQGSVQTVQQGECSIGKLKHFDANFARRTVKTQANK